MIFPVPKTGCKSKLRPNSGNNRPLEQCLKVFLKDKRNELIEEALQFAKVTCEDLGIPAEKKNCQEEENYAGEKAADDPLTLDQELKRSMLECIDRFQQEIATLCEGMGCYPTYRSKNSIIKSVFHSIIQSKLLRCKNNVQSSPHKPSKLSKPLRIETSEAELLKLVQSLFEDYNQLSADGILTEISHLRRFLNSAKVPKEESVG
ncbi:hypothetical protein AVEN_54168-1 [Araneus ventricosus]|uniref:Uncharacterized protein n=1 Tax=Araneus ventricosus TaxID=182803 RepID=A0A4Y2Q4D3_ARAVE|nr:hypothetical protein AVEN_54168-1 [Araneus ventricosus]